MRQPIKARREKNKWIFNKESFRNTPSIRHGMSIEEESQARYKGCRMIQYVSKQLQLTQIVTATASEIFHIFYMNNPLQTFHHYNIAASSLFLSCKIEESLRRMEDLIPAIDFYASKGNRKAVAGSKEYDIWKNIILVGEPRVLESIGFELNIEHPYVYVVEKYNEGKITKQVAQVGWKLVSETYKYGICIAYSNQEIADSCVAMAQEIVGKKKKEEKEAGEEEEEITNKEMTEWLFEKLKGEININNVYQVQIKQTGRIDKKEESEKEGSSSPMSMSE